MKIITIGRQFGSGGHDIGELVSKKLDYAFYDKKIVDMAAEKSNISSDAVKNVDEKATSSLLYSLVSGNYSLRGINAPLYYEMPLNDKLFIAESQIIKEIASKENSVIVGRCADYILEDDKNTELFNVFIYAPLEYRVKRVMSELNISEKAARDKVNKTDKQRKTYYSYYTNRDWGKMLNYDLCINSAKTGIDEAAQIITNYIRSLDK